MLLLLDLPPVRPLLPLPAPLLTPPPLPPPPLRGDDVELEAFAITAATGSLFAFGSLDLARMAAGRAAEVAPVAGADEAEAVLPLLCVVRPPPLFVTARPLVSAAEVRLADAGAVVADPLPDRDGFIESGGGGEGGGGGGGGCRDVVVEPPRGSRLLPPLLDDVSFSPSFLGFSVRSEAGAAREVAILVGVRDPVLDVLVADDVPPDTPADVAVEPEEEPLGVPDTLETLRLPPLELCAVPTATARRESRVFLAPRSLRKSRRAFCGFGSSFPSDSRISAWMSALGRGGAGDFKDAQNAL